MVYHLECLVLDIRITLSTCCLCIRFWHASHILNARDDWPKQKSLIDDSRIVPNGCVVNIKCGQSQCKFKLTAYEYRYDPEDFNPVSDVKTINTDLQEDRSHSGSVCSLKADNEVYPQVQIANYFRI